MATFAEKRKAILQYIEQLVAGTNNAYRSLEIVYQLSKKLHVCSLVHREDVIIQLAKSRDYIMSANAV